MYTYKGSLFSFSKDKTTGRSKLFICNNSYISGQNYSRKLSRPDNLQKVVGLFRSCGIWEERDSMCSGDIDNITTADTFILRNPDKFSLTGHVVLIVICNFKTGDISLFLCRHNYYQMNYADSFFSNQITLEDLLDKVNVSTRRLLLFNMDLFL